MSRGKSILAVLVSGALMSLGLTLALAAFLILVVFRDGPITPRNYTDEEKAVKRRDGSVAAAGAVLAFVAGAGTLWLGTRRAPPSSDGPGEQSRA